MSFRVASLLLCAIGAASFTLGGCTDFKRAVGMEKVVPDEFAVVSSAPLAIPPDYSLRPPRPGAAPSQEVSPTDQAKQSIFRAGDQQAALPPAASRRSTGEDELLRQAGAANASADIRQTIAEETQQAKPIESGFIDKLLFWRGSDNPVPPADSVIDPAQEAQQLRGPAVTSNGGPPPGMTGVPTIERKGQPRMLGAAGG